MDAQEARHYITLKVDVSRQKVAIAKEFILAHFSSDSEQLLQGLLREIDAVMPNEVVLHPSVDPIPTLEKTAASISWRLAGCEAVWGLIHAGAIIPASSDVREEPPNLRWTTVIPGSGGTTSGMDLREFASVVPRVLMLAPSRRFHPSEEILTDPDLYLRRINAEVGPAVKEALKEAVQCFKHGLYTACVAMLGKVTEECWVVLGTTLADVAQLEKKKAESLKAELVGWEIGIQSKIQKVVKLTDRESVKRVMKSAGIRGADINLLVVWSDLVRESRNVLHAGKEPLIPNAYEKVAVLLLNTAECVETVFRLVGAARKEPADPETHRS